MLNIIHLVPIHIWASLLIAAILVIGYAAMHKKKTGWFSAAIVTIDGISFLHNLKKQKTIMQQIKDTQTVFAVEFGAPVDAKGNQTSVQEGSTKWASSDDAIATVEPDPENPLRAHITPTGTVGKVSISLSADADLGEGDTEITGTADLEVVAGDAVGFGAPVFSDIDSGVK